MIDLPNIRYKYSRVVKPWKRRTLLEKLMFWTKPEELRMTPVYPGGTGYDTAEFEQIILRGREEFDLHGTFTPPDPGWDTATPLTEFPSKEAFDIRKIRQ